MKMSKINNAVEGLQKVIDELSVIDNALESIRELKRTDQLDVAVRLLEGLYFDEQLLNSISELLRVATVNDYKEDKVVLYEAIGRLIK